MKADLARRFPADINGYVDGKSALVKAVGQEAVCWYRAQRRKAPGLL